MSDPTYVKSEIEANPEWELAFTLSEIMNDAAPLGWAKFISPAKCLLAAYEIKRKKPTEQPPGDGLMEARPPGDDDYFGPGD